MKKIILKVAFFVKYFTRIRLFGLSMNRFSD